ncbi:uncharacterized protein [Leptinotarsa decemlineata]|uniref:uncharacterized protein n=1 Tax=Leptinotarsa decemlineata TaxID=7539 RepID=UPI003D309BEF
MVSHTTKVYARLKREPKNVDLETYQIIKKEGQLDGIIFSRNGTNNPVQRCFRFHKVFDQKSCQSEVFDAVAKPILNSIIEGFNGTIFAYGQTGSGKTYSITGSPKKYNERGIIPRSIQYIFEQNEMISEKPTIYISYMEIYNEVGYDLLSPKQHNIARSLEELPKIALLEDRKGEAHIRNLSVLPVTTEQDAMRLLFLGDTNRTIAETPMNEYSSRSHCIFTIYITHRSSATNKLRSSKLHLVDLAGSERVSKSLTTGLALHEAKHINLSLHFLQQVMLALSESKRSHIPYRNSIMTFILRDSLSGNCLTAMLATLAISQRNIQETISTCKFAQRVSLITTEPVINEISDPQHEISFLKSKIEELSEQLSSLKSLKNINEMTKDRKEHCRLEVETYLRNINEDEELKIDKPDFTQIQFCFNLLKKEFILQKKKYEDIKLKLEKSTAEVQKLKSDALRKNKEIDTLKNIIDKIPEHPVNLNSRHETGFQSDMDTKPPFTDCEQPQTCITDDNDEVLLKLYLSNPKNSNTLNFYRRALENKLEMAKLLAETIKQCQKNISCVREALENCIDASQRSHLITELEQQQNIYRRALTDLKDIQKETLHLESGLKRTEIKTEQQYRRWLEEYKLNRRYHKNNENYHPHCMNKIEYDLQNPSFSRITNHCLKPQNLSKSCICRSDNGPFGNESHTTSMTFENCSQIFLEEKGLEEYMAKSSGNGPNRELCGKLNNVHNNRCGQCCSDNSICSLSPESSVEKNMFKNVGTRISMYVSPDLSLSPAGNCTCLVPEKRNETSCVLSTCRTSSKENMIVTEPEIFPGIYTNECGIISSQTAISCFCTPSENENDRVYTSCNAPHTGGKKYYAVPNDHCEYEYRYLQPESQSSTNTVSGHTYSDQACPTETGLYPTKTKYHEIEASVQRTHGTCESTINLLDKWEAAKDSPSSECNDKTVVTSDLGTTKNHQSTTDCQNYYFQETDTFEFREFMKTITLTGDVEVDKEIYNFYRSKFC